MRAPVRAAGGEEPRRPRGGRGDRRGRRVKKFQPQSGSVVQAFRFALDPNAAQESALRSHCGAARAAYNWAVGWVEASWWPAQGRGDVRRS
ncbi:helix-turn-helix domain-containing protein [Streptomyces aurantiacus]|uniref:helix-turn-helix domain-containing protein n=1 Tax=Streptomyces aurantiacus TaxID=47760 RepID=UPI0035ED4BCF